MRKWLSYLLVILSCASSVWAQGVTPNRVLSLDGDGDYVEITGNEALDNIGSQVTMEVWIKLTEFPVEWIALVHKSGEKNPVHSNRSYSLALNSLEKDVELGSAPEGQGQMVLRSPDGLIRLNAWYHIAGTVDSKNGAMKIFVDGTEVASRSFGGDNIHVDKAPLLIGSWGEGKGFTGQMDEVRIWSIARTQEEIRETMNTSLSGEESDLVGYWNFDSMGNTAHDLSLSQAQGELKGDAHFVEAKYPTPDDPPTVVLGMVLDKSGSPIADASIRLKMDGVRIAETKTDLLGKYSMVISISATGLYDILAERDERGDSHLGIKLAKGERRTLNFILRKAISVSGAILMLDGKTPHVAITVQAIRGGRIIDTKLSDKGGTYSFVNLKPGEYQIRCHVLGGYVYYRTDRADGKTNAGNMRVAAGKTLSGIDFRIPPFKKGNWRNYTQTEGLADPAVTSIYRSPNGEMWFGTGAYAVGGSGVSRYDGRDFTNFSTEDGLADNHINAIHGSPDGVVWFGTESGGLSRYDGKTFVNFTTQDGLANDRISSIHCDSDGTVWFGTPDGVFRYDGVEFQKPLTTEDGLLRNHVRAIHCDPYGVVWLGTDGGVSRFDENELVSFTTENGLVHNRVNAICRDLDGIIWFGTEGGISRYDGETFANLTMEDGLVYNNVKTICCDPDGVMWFGTTRGVSRHDGRTFVNFTIEDGLIHGDVNAIHSTDDGAIWFGTSGGWEGGGGVSRYDEKSFANFSTEDGLASKCILDIHSAMDGVMWIGTRNGISLYDGKQFSSFSSPEGYINSVHSDSSGVIWVGGASGGFHYDGTEFVKFMDGNITVIRRAPDDAMWTGSWSRNGVFRYSSEGSINFTREKDGLADNMLAPGDVIDFGADGTAWLGTWSGVSRYNGKGLSKPLTTKDGLADNRVVSIHCADNGVVWIGTMSGISRYGGNEFTNFSTEDGLASSGFGPIHLGSDGIMWFGTHLYDGNAWSSLDMRDGLAGNSVHSIHQDSDGFLWFATEGGLTRYRRSTNPPQIRIVSVIAGKPYGDLSTIPKFSIGTRVTIDYSAIDLKTIPEKRQYQYRMREIDSDWCKPTKATNFDWTPEEPGIYTFEIRAIDRDLNYSLPGSLELTIVSPFYLRAAFLIPTIGSGAILLAVLVILATALTKRRKQIHAYQQAAVRELQDAREMQKSLLPEAAPVIEGMEIAGKSITANTVGGDFYDYLTLVGGMVGIAIADISGKGLRAAMNAAMANGMLHEVAVIEASCGRILSRLNAHLYPLMEKQMFTAFSFAILDTYAGVIHWANAAQPLPLIKRGSAASEVREDGELPLGMIPDVVYPDYQLRPQPGDIIILYTDGII